VREGLLDTCTVIALDRLAAELPEVSHISQITICELEAGVATAPTEAKRTQRQARLDAIRRIAVIHPLDDACSRAFGQVAADLRSQGRKITARSYDALIAATALALSLPLYTINPDDFRHICGLDVRTPQTAEETDQAGTPDKEHL
jgi:predicted nucleic acid-binding protein